MRYSLLLIILWGCLFRMSSQAFLREIVSPDTLDISNMPLVGVPSLGVFLPAQGQAFSLDTMRTSQTKVLAFPDSLSVDELIWNGEGFTLKSGSRIYTLVNGELNPLFNFDTDLYHIYSADHDRFYLTINMENLSSVYLCGISDKSVSLLLSVPLLITGIVGDGSVFYMAADEAIYSVSRDRMDKVFGFYEPIRSISLGDRGIFFATDNQVGLFVQKNEYQPIFMRGCRQIVADQNMLYMKLLDGTLLALDYEAYQKYLDLEIAE